MFEFGVWWTVIPLLMVVSFLLGWKLANIVRDEIEIDRLQQRLLRSAPPEPLREDHLLPISMTNTISKPREGGIDDKHHVLLASAVLNTRVHRVLNTRLHNLCPLLLVCR